MIWPKFTFFGLFVCVVLITSCNTPKSLAQNQNYKSTFDFDNAQVFNFEDELNEVSGLCYNEATDQLIAIEDENCIFYLLDKKNAAIIKKDSVYKEGDYEGVTNSKNYFFILKSTGTIYQVDKSNMEKKPKKIKSFLSKKYDAEGLTYDKAEHSLLITVKENLKSENKNERFIYAYDLAREKMNEEPYLVIKREEIVSLIQQKFSPEFAKDKFEKLLDKKRDGLHLGPSGIAIEPSTQNIFVISSKSKVLLIFNRRTKKLIDVIKLDKDTLPQPEGISFDNAGRLYIASEARESSAKLIIVDKEN